ncbi:hypothetical protein N9164_08225 [Draconibacterium sp.]|nr:hypothetical protein [Draconibacterium sp.]
MNTHKTLTYCGSITKRELLIPLDSHILENTWVAEANFPYANYYGQIPSKPKPNSLFLFTDRFYSLEEVLWFSNGFDTCYSEKLNIASAILEFQNKQHPAIRLKNFPNYEQLHMLQKCLVQLGIVFSKKTPLVTDSKVVINKCFELQELEEGLFLDKLEENKGYITFQKRINRGNFGEIVAKIRNNSNCSLFDAVPGGFIINSHSVDFIRVFSENLDLELLKCIKNQIVKFS